MREVTLRTRGEKEIRKLLNKKRRSKAATAAEILESDLEDEQDEVEDAGSFAGDGLNEAADPADDDAMSVGSVDTIDTSTSRAVAQAKGGAGRLEIVIEDSDEEI